MRTRRCEIIMLCSHKKKFIYLKTKKTAGTSIEVFFERFCSPPELYVQSRARDELITDDGIIGSRGDVASSRFFNHMRAAKVRELLGNEVWSTYYKFCAIRNPFDKVVSSFWMKLNEIERWRLHTASFELVRKNFFEFCSNPFNFPIDKDVFMIDGVVAVD